MPRLTLYLATDRRDGLMHMAKDPPTPNVPIVVASSMRDLPVDMELGQADVRMTDAFRASPSDEHKAMAELVRGDSRGPERPFFALINGLFVPCVSLAMSIDTAVGPASVGWPEGVPGECRAHGTVKTEAGAMVFFFAADVTWAAGPRGGLWLFDPAYLRWTSK